MRNIRTDLVRYNTMQDKCCNTKVGTWIDKLTRDLREIESGTHKIISSPCPDYTTSRW
jgi:hypothetical protein